jgi:hypothetical protein
MPFGGFAPLPFRLGGVDARDQWTAAQHARLCADLVALSNVMPIAALLHEQDVATLASYQSMMGAASSPTVTVLGGGVSTYEWAAGFAGPYEDHAGFRIRHAVARPCAQPAMGFGFKTFCEVDIETATRVRVRTINDAGGVSTSNPIALVIW